MNPTEAPRACRSWNRRAGQWQFKARFDTRADAVAAQIDPALVPYPCHDCRFWHLGHPKASKESAA